jgi:hypothetical protein
VTVNDVDGSSVQTNKTSVSVADAALTDTTVVKTVNATEGNSIGTNVVLMTFTDGDPQAPLTDFTPTVNWGGTLTGTPTASVQLVSRTGGVSTWQVVGSAVYTEPGTYTVTVTVIDADGASVQTNKVKMSVTDAALSNTTSVTTFNAVEGNSTGNIVIATFSDANPLAPVTDFTTSVDWGGTLIGTPTATVQLMSRTASVSNWQVVGNAVYAEKGTNFKVTVTITDVDGSTLTSSNKTKVTVTDAPLTDTTPVATLNSVEGNSTGSIVLATFSDADPSAPLTDFTPTVNWGGTLIGTATTSVQLVSRTATTSNWQVVGTATYAEKGTFTVTVTVNDVDGSSVQTNKTSVSVADGALTDTTPAATLNSVEGASIGTNVVLATFSDGDPSAPLTDFTPVVDWGGTLIGTGTATVQLVSRSATVSIWQVVGSAVYADQGNHTLTVTVNDIDGASAQTDKTSVNVVDLMDTTAATTVQALQGSSIGTDVVLMTFTDDDPAAAPSDFTPTVDWGGTLSGTSDFSLQLVSTSATASLWQVVGSATYAATGTYTVTVTVADVDGASIQTNKTHVHVGDLIDASTATTLDAVEGNSIGTDVVLMTFTDANPFAPLADFTPVVDWGGTLIGTPTTAVQLVSRSATESTWQVVGTATYAETGSYTVTATDRFGRTATFSPFINLVSQLTIVE